MNWPIDFRSKKGGTQPSTRFLNSKECKGRKETWKKEGGEGDRWLVHGKKENPTKKIKLGLPMGGFGMLTSKEGTITIKQIKKGQKKLRSGSCGERCYWERSLDFNKRGIDGWDWSAERKVFLFQEGTWGNNIPSARPQRVLEGKKIPSGAPHAVRTKGLEQQLGFIEREGVKDNFGQRSSA